MKRCLLAALVAVIVGCAGSEKHNNRASLANAMEHSLRNETLARWYPRNFDTVYGGFLSTFTYDFNPTGDQDKMIVTQARHTWANARASERYPEVADYKLGAKHGFAFLRDVMWDKTFGGFYVLVDRAGHVKGDSTKTAYGNAFGIYALAAYYRASNDTAGLNLARKAFMWLERGSHDGRDRGYFQHLHRDGSRIVRTADTPSTAETGYKDQNSSIHLLEAFTELYEVWPDPLVKTRLEEMLLLVRNTIVTPQGHLTLFLQPDWTPVSFRDSSAESISRHHRLDHVSFGHDVETAYLMLEASHVLGWQNDTVTLRVAKHMVDQALRHGWDEQAGGFYDEGYYFKNKPGMTITADTKNWWAQAEGLNTLLLMADQFPYDPMNYYAKFEKLWQYCDTQLIDHTYGDWYAGGVDKQPDMRLGLKGHIWKGIYHHYRALTNCVDRLRKNQHT